jgi:hypothetical protein
MRWQIQQLLLKEQAQATDQDMIIILMIVYDRRTTRILTNLMPIILGRGMALLPVGCLLHVDFHWYNQRRHQVTSAKVIRDSPCADGHVSGSATSHHPRPSTLNQSQPQSPYSMLHCR